jgi:hypothetical protein
MGTITGTYYKGKLKLDKPLLTKKPVKVTISYEEDELTSLTLSDFSFAEMQKLLIDCRTSFSDEVVEERRKAV